MFLLVLLIVFFFATPILAQAPSTVGGETQVNTFTLGTHSYADIAVDESGSFVVVWHSTTSPGTDSSSTSIQARRFDSSGVGIGTQFQVNSVTADTQRYASLDIGSSGDFVVVWETYGAGLTFHIAAQRFASDGTALGSEIAVNSYTSGNQSHPKVAMLSDNRFVVTWYGSGTDIGDFSGDTVIARLFDSSGAAVGNDFRVNSYTFGDQNRPDIAVLDNDEMVVVWEDQNQVKGQRLDASGSALGSELTFDTRSGYTDRQPAADSDGSNGFNVVWTSSYGGNNEIVARHLDSAGSFTDTESVVTTTYVSSPSPGVAALGDSSFIVTWEDFTSFNTNSHAVRVSSDGTPTGDEFQINTTADQTQRRPSVSSSGDGSFAVAWDGKVGTSYNQIAMQRYSTIGSIGDRVFFDADADGVQDDGEVGVEGVTVDLHEVGVGLVDSAVTDADGEYLFEDLMGEFYLQFHLPSEYPAFTVQDAGADDTVDSDVDTSGQTANIVAVGDNLDWDAGLARAELTGTVWHDLDGNGVRDPGEPAIEGATLTLKDADGVEIDQDTSDPEGTYQLISADGTFYLEVTAPDGYGFTLQNQGDDGYDSDVNASGVSAFFEMALGEVAALDAGLIGPSKIGNRVWLDADLDGIQDGGEVGVSGVTVELFHADGTSQGTTTTASDGSYAFAALPAGTYYLAFSEPAGFCFTAQNQGADDTVDSDVDPVTFTTALFTLAEAATDLSRDAGLVPDASIGNRVWLDDGNGIQEGDEPGVSDVTVHLYDQTSTLLDTATTDGDGYFAFSPGPGQYYLEFVVPPDMAFTLRDQGSDDTADSDPNVASGTTSWIELHPGTVASHWDAGLEPAVIGDRVWLDQNGDGLRQPTESGLGGITVRLLTDGDSLVASTITDADGHYSFLGVPDGTYIIKVIPPLSGVFSTQDAGTNDLIDSDINPSNGKTAPFDYTAASASRSHDAGIQLIAIFANGFESGDTSAWSTADP